MFDATYFRTALPAQVKNAGEGPTVELYLITGQSHRIRSVVDVADGYVVLEVYQRRAEGTRSSAPWIGAPSEKADPEAIHHAVVSYESISQVIMTSQTTVPGARIGFGS